MLAMSEISRLMVLSMIELMFIIRVDIKYVILEMLFSTTIS